MLSIVATTQFRRDLKRQAKRGYDVGKLEDLVKKISLEKPLENKFKNHKLPGNFIDRWECHIEPDWLLIYRISESSLFLERTGSHSDLF